MKIGSATVGLWVVLGALGAFGCDRFSSKKDASPAASGSSAALAATPEKVGALSEFEGELGIAVKSADPKEKPIPPFTLQVKAGKLRVDLPLDAEQTAQLGGKAYVIANVPDKKLLAVLDGKKQVVQLDINTLGEQAKALKSRFSRGKEAAEEKPELPKIVKTGRKDRVIGRECEEWEITSSKNADKLVVCVSDEGTSWLRLPFTATLPAEYAWMAQLADGKSLPLRAVVFKDGKEKLRMELTRLEQKKMDAALFEAPAGYAVLSLEEAIQGFMAGAMGRAGMPAGAAMGMPAGAGLPPGMKMPPGMPAGMPTTLKLPPGFKLPPGVKLPPGMEMPSEPAK
ncbi:MAG: DUF4412 domain-containing protein [Polyangiaceae bacterium]|nr:DUF4412 domain-containing protein [Polyangiaceae bacterium]